MQIQISAIVCTYNRSNYLKRTLKSLIKQSLDNQVYEIIVVDNASTDNTKKMVSEYSRINFKYSYESKLALSIARNTGLEKAKGKYVAYIDDDAIADEYWLQNILSSFKKEKNVGCIGGRVKPIWESKKPVWLDYNLYPFLSLLDKGKKRYIFSESEWFSGTNMAFRKDLLRKIGGFPVHLGRKGNYLLSGEEVYVKQKIENLGYLALYNPEALVHHSIPGSRLAKQWFIGRLFWQGVTNAVMEPKKPFLHQLRSGIAMSLPVFFNLDSLSALFDSSDDPKLFYEKCRVIGRFGYSMKMLRLI